MENTNSEKVCMCHQGKKEQNPPTKIKVYAPMSGEDDPYSDNVFGVGCWERETPTETIHSPVTTEGFKELVDSGRVKMCPPTPFNPPKYPTATGFKPYDPFDYTIVDDPCAAPPPPFHKPILQEAHDAITGSKKEAYGPAKEHFGKVAETWALYLKHKYGVTITLVAEDVCWMMADLKRERQMFQSKRDSVLDHLGYVALIEEVADL